jgi:hypothetical protein
MKAHSLSSLVRIRARTRNPAAKEKIVLARFGYFRKPAQHRFTDDLPVQVAK